jgi:hypothetical protein
MVNIPAGNLTSFKDTRNGPTDLQSRVAEEKGYWYLLLG